MEVDDPQFTKDFVDRYIPWIAQQKLKRLLLYFYFLPVMKVVL
jgi:hypothetical protein